MNVVERMRTRYLVGLLAAPLMALAACTSNSTPGNMSASGGSSGSGGQPATAASGSGGVGGSAAGMSAGGAAGGEPSVAAAVALAVGPFSACTAGPDRGVKCAGRCGPAGKGGSREQAPAGVQAVMLAAGREFVCALLPAAQAGSLVQCWGVGMAAEPPVLADATAVVAGDSHACALGAQGNVTCWGDAAHAAPAGLVAKQLAASGAMTCAIQSADTITCWGNRPAEPPADLKALHVAVSSQLTDAKLGPRFGCAVTPSNEVRCWGDDPGQVQMIPSGLKAKQVAVGRSNACAIGMDDTVSCWGLAPRYGSPLPAGLKAKALALSFRSAAAVTLEGKLAFWGDTSDGRGSL